MTYRNTFSAATLMLAFLMLLPHPAAAQEAHSFEQLQILVKPGDRIFITDATGNITVGKVTGLSKSSLSLKTKTSTKDWSESEVLKIRQWRHDSLKNGTLIGTGVGLGLGVLSAWGWCDGWGDCGGEGAAIMLYFTALGAGIGVGVDALIPSKQTIYLGRERTALNRLKLKPIVTNSRKGVAVGFSF